MRGEEKPLLPRRRGIDAPESGGAGGQVEEGSDVEKVPLDRPPRSFPVLWAAF